MGLLNLFKRNKGVKTDFAVNPESPEYSQVNDFGGARQTIPKFSQNGGGGMGALSKKTQRDLGLDERKFSNYSIPDLLDVLTDAHPDVSFALWNFMRIANSGYTINVRKLGNGKEWTQAEKDLNELIDRLKFPNVLRFEKSRSLDRVIIQMIHSAVVRGAVAGELVLTPAQNDVVFISPVDPSTIDFKFEGDRYIPYQNQEKLKLDIPTFFYEGLDERIDDPYGRSPLMSAISTVLFQLQILNDLKAVIHNQGYPRLDIRVIEEVLLKRMPMTIRNNEAKKQEWLNEKLKEIIDMYSELEPDDTFVHYDSVEIGMAGESKAMFDPQKLMSAIDGLIVSGLKTLSTILGRRSTGNTEGFAKIEIKLYLMGVRAIQEVVETVMSRMLTLALNIRGKQGIVEFKFNPVEIRTELEKAQFEQIHLMNCQFKRDQGWIDQTEAAMLAVGHAPVSETPLVNDTPTNGDGSTPSGSTDTNPQAGGSTDNANGN